MFIDPRHQLARLFIQHDQAGGFRFENLLVLQIQTVTGIQIEVPPVKENGTVSRIVWVNIRLGTYIEHPEYVRILLCHIHSRFTRLDHVLAFIHIWSIIAVGHALHVETNHLCSVRYHIDAVSLHRRRRTERDVRLVKKSIVAQQPGDHQLPDHLSVPLIKTEQHTLVPLVTSILGSGIIGADQDFLGQNHWANQSRQTPCYETVPVPIEVDRPRSNSR